MFSGVVFSKKVKRPNCKLADFYVNSSQLSKTLSAVTIGYRPNDNTEVRDKLLNLNRNILKMARRIKSLNLVRMHFRLIPTFWVAAKNLNRMTFYEASSKIRPCISVRESSQDPKTFDCN